MKYSFFTPLFLILFHTTFSVAQPSCGGFVHDHEIDISKSFGRLDYTWSGQIIPYTFAANLPPNVQNVAEAEIKFINKTTNICLIPHRNESHSLQIRPGDGGDVFYSSHLGYHPGESQFITINNTGYIVQHEIGHAIGLIHEHQRPDRDSFISIHHSNIQRNFISAFRLYNFPESFFKSDYDYKSVMHYTRYAFSSNGQPTISTDSTQLIGGLELSPQDIIGINALYPDSTLDCNKIALERSPKVSINIAAESQTYLCSEVEYQFFADATEDSPNRTFEWTFQGGTPSSSTEQNPKVTFSQNGLVAVSLKVTNDYGSTTFDTGVFIQMPETTIELKGVNASNQQIFLEIDNAVPQIIQMQLVAIDGKTVGLFDQFIGLVCEEPLTLSTDKRLLAGVYYLKVRLAEEEEVYPIFIK